MNFIQYEQKDAVAVLTISREKALNALNSEVLTEMESTIDAIDLETVRCLIITRRGSKILCCRRGYRRDEHAVQS